MTPFPWASDEVIELVLTATTAAFALPPPQAVSGDQAKARILGRAYDTALPAAGHAERCATPAKPGVRRR